MPPSQLRTLSHPVPEMLFSNRRQTVNQVILSLNGISEASKQ
jgi:hypothetical protein